MTRDYGEQSGQDHANGLMVSHALRGEGFDASEDGTGRGTPLVPVGVDGFNGSLSGPVAATMGTRGSSETASGPQVMVPIALDPTQITSATNRSNPQPGDPCHTLAKGQHAPAICFSAKDHGADAMQDCSPTLRAGGHSGSHANAGVMPAVALALRGRDGGATAELGDEVQNALRASGGGGDKAHVLAAMQVRRLTPVECARLQGFPDHYLDITYRGKPAADGPKYKALGNSWAVPVVRWIGERIEAVEAICAEQERKVA